MANGMDLELSFIKMGDYMKANGNVIPKMD